MAMATSMSQFLSALNELVPPGVDAGDAGDAGRGDNERRGRWPANGRTPVEYSMSMSSSTRPALRELLSLSLSLSLAQSLPMTLPVNSVVVP